MSVELRLLRSFVAVAEEMSFTAAARRLHMAQPPLSMQIRRLEEELGFELFDRSRRAISLTAAGEALFAETRPLLIQVEQTLNAARRAGQGEVGRLSIGFVPAAANGALPRQLREFRARFPGVELFLREMPPDGLVLGLGEGSIDLCFFYLPFSDSRFHARTVERDSLVAALPSGHHLAGGRGPLRVEQLAGEPFVLPARHGMPGLRALVLGACRDAGFEPTAVQQDVWLSQTILALVASGLGVALVPGSAQKLRRAGVVIRRLEGLDDPVELGALWRVDQGSPALRNFLATLPDLEAGGPIRRFDSATIQRHGERAKDHA
jgi:DNA-binding transcriptional LysR family regulator